MTDAHQYCQDKAAASGSSFYYSFLFLPTERRRAITALYAYCREVDDVVDECTDPGVARSKLTWWREEVARLYEGKPQHPVARALADVVGTYGITRDQLLTVIDGMAMDLEYNRYPDFDTLKLYCHRVAGVVGLMSARIFGYSDAHTLDYAADLGLAFQLTNIIRDVGEDARRNRVYLPLDELAKAGLDATQIVHGHAHQEHSENFRKLMEQQVARAQATYDRAFAQLPQQDRKAQIPGIIMAAIYRTLLEEIRADGCRVLTHRTSLTPVRKLWIAWKTWIKG
ncbi:MAG: presqualene diphosphate synthase HpnD [Burkholderiales bacterium]|jgi:15-cis-phytoene synthase|nr:presqualene diphosphate synthase HpnD [Burkholderiales bacterium]